MDEMKIIMDIEQSLGNDLTGLKSTGKKNIFEDLLIFFFYKFVNQY